MADLPVQVQVQVLQGPVSTDGKIVHTGDTCNMTEAAAQRLETLNIVKILGPAQAVLAAAEGGAEVSGSATEVEPTEEALPSKVLAFFNDPDLTATAIAELPSLGLSSAATILNTRPDDGWAEEIDILNDLDEKLPRANWGNVFEAIRNAE